MSTSQGKSFGYGALEEQLCLLGTVDLLAFPQQASCFQECYFCEESFSRSSLLYSFPHRPALKCIVRVAAYQLSHLFLIILHLLYFSQGSWDFHILET